MNEANQSIRDKLDAKIASLNALIKQTEWDIAAAQEPFRTKLRILKDELHKVRAERGSIVHNCRDCRAFVYKDDKNTWRGIHSESAFCAASEDRLHSA